MHLQSRREAIGGVREHTQLQFFHHTSNLIISKRSRERLLTSMEVNIVRLGIPICLGHGKCRPVLLSVSMNLNGIRSRPPTIRDPLLYLRYLLTPYTATEKAGLERTKWFRTKEAAIQRNILRNLKHWDIHSPIPPVGLLAWIFEKLVNWTDEYPWDDDEGQ